MTPDRWKQVSQVYDAARERPASEREVFLAQACAGDASLQHEVQALLDQPTSPKMLDGLTPSVVAEAMAGDESHGLTGRRFGPYYLHERIGTGGMGEVYRARDTKLGRDVAIKVLPQAFADDPDRIARFEREARVLASLDHPHIGTIHAIEESDGIRALVLALVEGDTLADRIARGPLPIPEALKYAKQMADALEAAHDRGIIHRDFKPGNIKITPAGVIKVLDFGLAKLWTSPAGTSGDNLTPSPVQSAGTRMGMILGTAAYMSPEQARGRPVDRRTDIWAFGCVLFEMLTGTRAFAGQEVADVLAGVIEREPDFKSLPATTPPAILRVLRRSLEKDHRRRLSDIADARLEIDEAIAEPAAPVAVRTGARWRVGAVASLLTVIVLGGLAALYLRQGASELAINRFEIVTPSPTFDSVSFALSPNGRQLVFIANVRGQQQLWIRPLDQTLAQPLAGTEGASFPFWAPDSRSIGFFADGKLKRLDLSGGQPLVLADAPLPLGGSWSSEGTILFAPYERLLTTKLMRVSATGGVAKPVPGTGFGSPRFPEFLPDGRQFLFFMRWTSGKRNGVYLGALDTQEVRRLLEIDTAVSYAPPGYLLFVRQGVLMAVSFDASSGTVVGEPMPVAPAVNSIPGRRSAFSVSSSGLLAHRAGSASGRQLTWFDRGGTVVGTMGPPDSGPLASPDLAPDGQRVAIGRQLAGNVDIWLLDGAADVWSRLTFSPSAENRPVWAPDGSRLAFTSNRDRPDRRSTQIFEKPSDGSGNERLLFTSDSNEVWPVDWSRDGRMLLYSNQDPKTDGDLWALPLTGHRTPFPVVRTPFLEQEGQFSPDGRWIAFRSNQSGRDEVYVQAFPGPAGSQLVSTRGGSQPRWRRDGKELLYVAADETLMVVSIGSSIGQKLGTGKPVPLFRTRLSAGDQPRQQYAVAPDGQRFLMNVLAEEVNIPPITIVQNWTVALRK